MYPNHLDRIDYVLNCLFLSYNNLDNEIKNNIITILKKESEFYFSNEEVIFNAQNIKDLLKFKKSIFWNNQQFFIFSNINSNLIIKKEDNTLEIKFDILSNIFFYLSGYQEIIIKERDELNRFTFQSSIQKIMSTETIPVVNLLFSILVKVINQKFNINLINKFQEPFVWVTSDVDIWKGNQKNNLKYSIKNFKIITLIKSILFYKKDDWIKNLNKIEELYNFKTTLFFMSVKEKYKNYNNADYNISENRFLKIINKIQKNILGIHPSFESSFKDEIMKKNIRNLPFKTELNRFHFLQYNINKTPKILRKNDIKIDTTLGFSDSIGFRNGTSLPFYLFDFETNSTSTIIEIPLLVMDATLFYNHYKNIKTKEEFWKYINPLIEQLQKHGGIFTLNFHNHIFTEKSYDFWKICFIQLLEKCKQKNFKFINESIISYLN